MPFWMLVHSPTSPVQECSVGDIEIWQSAKGVPLADLSVPDELGNDPVVDRKPAASSIVLPIDAGACTTGESRKRRITIPLALGAPRPRPSRAPAAPGSSPECRVRSEGIGKYKNTHSTPPPLPLASTKGPQMCGIVTAVVDLPFP